MYPGTFAETTPDKAAIVMATSGEVVTYRELNDRSNQLAQYWYAAGLRRGDHVAVMTENRPEFFVVAWAAMRSGLYLTTINRYLSPEEAAYIANDSAAASIVTTKALEGLATAIMPLLTNDPSIVMIDADETTPASVIPFAAALAGQPASPLAAEPKGELMLYSSGTTGQPKGIKRPMVDVAISDPGQTGLHLLLQFMMGATPEMVFLSPAPLYHAAPLWYGLAVGQLGATLVIMEKFTETDYLRAVEAYSVTHSQLVPTMFIRMLKLDEEVRARYDVSSLERVVHAAAPCPAPIKEQMIDWWGPIIEEYYSGTEGNGMTWINSADWLTHKGSVGKPLYGEIHICDDDGNEVPVGESGTVFFDYETAFEYHGDAAKTKQAYHPNRANWSALGDVGYVDDDGFLFLTDRKAFMIISGGVNIYPQEIEDCLVMHPKVADVAVFGLPDDEMGEFVQAVVQPAEGLSLEGAEADDLISELRQFARERIAHYKVPRVFDLSPALPRLPTGKLYKRLLKDEYVANMGDERAGRSS